jgi:hypothetical protein
MTAQAAIHRYQRDVALGRVLRSLLLAGAAASVLVLPFVLKGFDSMIGLSVIFGLWLFLSFTSAKNSRILGPSAQLIATGQFEEAEQRIEQAMRAFSISRTSKLMGLHHLAVLRHKQRRWHDAISLCRAVLAQRLSALPALERSTRLMLADSLLEVGDTRAAALAITPLRGQQLPLVDMLTLVQVELDVLARLGAWDAVVAGLPGKVQLAELMPPQASARAQAALALAARKRGMNDWAEWLRKRVELLADVGKLTEQRPALMELWRA